MRPKQTRFVEEYLTDLNASQAALRAGYSPKTAFRMGQENLQKPAIAAAIAAAQAARSQRTAISADRVLQELARLAFVDLRRFYATDGALKRPSEIDDDTAAALSSVEIDELWGVDAEGARTVLGQTKKIRVWDKVASLKLLAQHLGLLSKSDPLGDLGQGLASLVSEAREALRAQR